LKSLPNFEAGDRSNTPADKKERFGAWHSDKVSVQLSFKLRQNKNIGEFAWIVLNSAASPRIKTGIGCHLVNSVIYLFLTK